MAGTVFKNIDKQRFKKVYPARRRAPVMVKQSGKEVIIETVSLAFTESSSVTSKTYAFTEIYNTSPNVTYGVKSTSGDMVLVKITALSTSSVTIEISAPFDGTVDLQIVEIAT